MIIRNLADQELRIVFNGDMHQTIPAGQSWQVKNKLITSKCMQDLNLLVAEGILLLEDDE